MTNPVKKIKNFRISPDTQLCIAFAAPTVVVAATAVAAAGAAVYGAVKFVESATNID